TWATVQPVSSQTVASYAWRVGSIACARGPASSAYTQPSASAAPSSVAAIEAPPAGRRLSRRASSIAAHAARPSASATDGHSSPGPLLAAGGKSSWVVQEKKGPNT